MKITLPATNNPTYSSAIETVNSIYDTVDLTTVLGALVESYTDLCAIQNTLDSDDPSYLHYVESLLVDNIAPVYVSNEDLIGEIIAKISAKIKSFIIKIFRKLRLYIIQFVRYIQKRFFNANHTVRVVKRHIKVKRSTLEGIIATIGAQNPKTEYNKVLRDEYLMLSVRTCMNMLEQQTGPYISIPVPDKDYLKLQVRVFDADITVDDTGLSFFKYGLAKINVLSTLEVLEEVLSKFYSLLEKGEGSLTELNKILSTVKTASERIYGKAKPKQVPIIEVLEQSLIQVITSPPEIEKAQISLIKLKDKLLSVEKLISSIKDGALIKHDTSSDEANAIYTVMNEIVTEINSKVGAVCIGISKVSATVHTVMGKPIK